MTTLAATSGRIVPSLSADNFFKLLKNPVAICITPYSNDRMVALELKSPVTNKPVSA